MPPTPAKTDLFSVSPETSNPLLITSTLEYFHSITAKLLHLSKRSRPDILTPVAFLPKRVTKPQTDDMKRLERTVQYIRGTRDLGLTLTIGDPMTGISYIDASYGVHQDMKSHTGPPSPSAKDPSMQKAPLIDLPPSRVRRQS